MALLVVQLAFGSQAVEGKLAMMPRAEGGAGIPPTAVAMARMIGATVFFQALFFVRARMRDARAAAPTALTARDHATLFALSLLGITVNQTLFLLGLQRTTPISAALLCVTIPVFTAAMSIVSGQERMSVRFAFGLLLALGGAVTLTGVTHVDRGAILVLVNSLSYASYLVLGRPVIRRLGAMTVMRWVFTWGAISFLPLGSIPLRDALAGADSFAFGMFAYLIVFPTIVAYLANAWALGRSSATLVTIYIYLQPLVAAVLGWLQLGQPLTTRALAAALLILCGVTIVATRRA